MKSKNRARTKELEMAVEVKSRFLAIMSHEIRTPLSGILSSLSLLADSSLSTDQLNLLRIGQGKNFFVEKWNQK